LSSSSAFQQSLRRLKPEKHLKKLAYRDRAQLRFLPGLNPPFLNSFSIRRSALMLYKEIYRIMSTFLSGPGVSGILR
jgi:hypothetical protein